MTDRYFDPGLGVWITRCAPGESEGARDLQEWSSRRAIGLSGSDGFVPFDVWKAKQDKGRKKRRKRKH